MLLLLLCFRMLLILFWGVVFLPLHLFHLHLASLCVFFFSFGHVLSCSAWPVLRGGLAALCLVSQLSVWSRGALLRRLSQCLCEYELVCILSRVLHLVSHVPLPLRSKHRGTLRLSVIDLAPRGGGRDGCICRGGRIICQQLHQLGPPLCGPPHRVFV